MSHLVSRILLTVFLLPAAVIVYILTFFVCIAAFRNEVIEFIIAGSVTWAFIAIYWILLWRIAVRWTPWRIWGTVAEAAFLLAAGAFLSILADLLVNNSRGSFGAFCASMFVPTAWLIATVYLWRETAEERRSRFASSSARAVACPTCGYNLTGLAATRCPECGNQCTLDELFAAQSNAASNDVES